MAVYTDAASAIQARHFSQEATDAAQKSVVGDRVTRMFSYVKKTDTVLDLGCNDGSISDMLRPLAAKVYAADFPEVVAMAQKRYPEVSFMGFNASRAFPIPDGQFDLVTASEIIEHIVDDVGFLQECHRILKPGGRLVITTPNIGFIRDRIWLLKGIYQDNPMHVHLYTFDNMTLKFEGAGFKNITSEGYRYNIVNGSLSENLQEFKRQIGFQHAFWHFLEHLLPKTFCAGMVMCGTKPSS